MRLWNYLKLNVTDLNPRDKGNFPVEIDLAHLVFYLLKMKLHAHRK